MVERTDFNRIYTPGRYSSLCVGHLFDRSDAVRTFAQRLGKLYLVVFLRNTLFDAFVRAKRKTT